MKIFYALIAIVVLPGLHSSIANALPATCEGTIRLTSQADVNNFATAYGCTEINGNLFISGADIVNLDGLEMLTRVNGGLTIINNPKLTSPRGLRFITYIGHDPSDPEFPGLQIIANNILSSVDHLHGILEIDGVLRISNNAKVGSISGLPNLQTVGVEATTGLSVVIKDNPYLTNLQWLSAITEVGGIIEISGNSNMYAMEGFQNLTQINTTNQAGIIISNNASLSNIIGFQNLTSIRGNRAEVSIINNDRLINLNGFRMLTAIEGTVDGAKLNITGNVALEEIRGLSAVTHLGGSPTLIITDNARLQEGCGVYSILANWDNSGSPHVEISGNGSAFTRESILADGPCPKVCYIDVALSSQAQVDAFQSNYGCGEITGTLSISGPDITNLDSLYTLEKVNGDLRIQFNPSLVSIEGLSSLVYVGGGGGPEPGLHITANASLTSLEGLNKLKSVRGMIHLIANTALENITALSSLSSIGAPFPTGTSLVVTDHPVLTSLEGLNSIKRLGGSLVVSNNNLITDLTGLDSLTSVGGSTSASFHITNNASLVSLNGINALTTVSGRGAWLNIHSNPKLTNVDALAGLESMGGTPGAALEIINNASLTNLDGLSEFISLGPDGYLSVVDNPNLTSGCGIYKLLTRSWEYGRLTADIARNGAGVTKEAIIEAGPCTPGCDTLPRDKHVFAEFASGRAPHSTNIIVRDYEPGVTYQLHRSDGTLVAGPYPGSVGLFAGNITETTTFYVVAKISATGCQREMITRPVVTIYPDSTDCTGVHFNEKTIRAEQDTLAPDQATNVLVLDGNTTVDYVLRDNADNREVAGPYPSTVGLYSGALHETTTFNVLAIHRESGCSQQLSELVTITVLDESSRFAVYPNPSNGEFFVEAKGNAGLVSIYDLNGTTVTTQRVESGIESAVDLRGARPGVYQLLFNRADGKVETRRVVIE